MNRIVNLLWFFALAAPFFLFGSHGDNNRQHDTDRGHASCNREQDHSHNQIGFEQRQNLYEYNLYERNKDRVEEEQNECCQHCQYYPE